MGRKPRTLFNLVAVFFRNRNTLRMLVWDYIGSATPGLKNQAADWGKPLQSPRFRRSILPTVKERGECSAGSTFPLVRRTPERATTHHSRLRFLLSTYSCAANATGTTSR